MVQVQALFKSGGTKVLKGKTAAKPATKKTVPSKVGTVKKAATIKKAAPPKNKPSFRKVEGEALWLPNTTRPDWLDGSLPGDRGFDPLGLSKPVSYLQYDVDSLDQNKAVNKKGGVVGEFKPAVDQVSTDALQPYSEVFGLQRFRECELIHGRWAMLACLGALVAEGATGVSWVDAGKVELDGASYLGFDLPFSITQLVWIEALAVGGAELYRNSELDPEKRAYPGGVFDPLNLASADDPEKVMKLRESEIKHARLAMIAFLGYGVQALSTGEGALGSLAAFSKSF